MIEILMGASRTVFSNAQSRKMLDGAGGGNHYPTPAAAKNPSGRTG
jgi:hypothetical protein